MIKVVAAEFAYGTQRVLRGVSFEAVAGAVYGVLGPNGSGKTTLLRLILGFLRPQAGQVLVSGRAVSDYRRREFARLCAAVPQEMPIDFPFTVTELVLMGRTPHLGALGLEAAPDLSAASGAMAACGITELARRSIHTLSGGELRRAFIARALAQRAPVLLLDEPTAGLDIHHQLAIFELLRAQVQSGCCVVVVVHDLNLAAAFCDRLLLLKQGRAVAEGTVSEVLTAERIREVYDVELTVVPGGAGKPRFLIPSRRGA